MLLGKVLVAMWPWVPLHDPCKGDSLEEGTRGVGATYIIACVDGANPRIVSQRWSFSLIFTPLVLSGVMSVWARVVSYRASYRLQQGQRSLSQQLISRRAWLA